MKKYENLCVSLENMKDIYNYEEPYDNVVLTGLVGLYEITFEDDERNIGDTWICRRSNKFSENDSQNSI